jgi:hypothetical protein
LSVIKNETIRTAWHVRTRNQEKYRDTRHLRRLSRAEKDLDYNYPTNRELEGKDRDLPNPKVTRLIDKQLSSIDSVDEDTGFVYEIRVIGIFTLDTFVRVHCPHLQKASLYRNKTTPSFSSFTARTAQNR